MLVLDSVEDSDQMKNANLMQILDIQNAKIRRMEEKHLEEVDMNVLEEKVLKQGGIAKIEERCA